MRVNGHNIEKLKSGTAVLRMPQPGAKAASSPRSGGLAHLKIPAEAHERPEYP